MKSKTILTYLRRILFLLVTIAILVHMNAIFFRKSDFAHRIGGFRYEPEHSMDLIAFGSSHMYCTLMPVYLNQQTGLQSYDYCTMLQPPVATYYYVKEAFKTQSPDVILVEAYMFARDDATVTEAAAHEAIGPMPPSLDKIKLILEMNQTDAKENYFVNFLKYHSRWKELTEADFDLDFRQKTDPFHGASVLLEVTPTDMQAVSYDSVASVAVPEENKQILLDIQALAQENGAQMLLLFAPCNLGDSIYGAYKTLRSFADANGIPYLDLNENFDALGIDTTTEFYDEAHLNIYGAEKATEYIGQYVLEHYTFTPKQVDASESWKVDWESYCEEKGRT